MSSNQHIPMLTRDNYEETFLLYVDDELTAAQRAAVEAFVLLHPDLKEELDVLCSTKLPAEDFLFDAKTELFSGSMKVNAMQESLLLYIDNELDATEMNAITERLKSDPAFAHQHALLLKTKLEPEALVYPYKSGLYRKTERRIAPYWLRVAAAVAIVAGSAVVWMNTGGAKTALPDVAVVTPKKPAEQKPAVTKQFQNPISGSENNNSVAIQKTTTVQNRATVQKNAVAIKTLKTSTPTFSNPHIVTQNVIAHTTPLAHEIEPEESVAIAVPKKQVPLNNLSVTSEKPLTYVSAEDAANRTVVPVHPVAFSNERQSGGLKGLLRKATRVLERRTGIKAVNDDDELLVGAVALKL